MLDLSIVIPCYREEHRLPPTLKKTIEFIEYFSSKYKTSVEIILIVEPSPDNTMRVANEWGTKYSFIHILENKRRLGKGGSVQKGMLLAKGEIILFMDADGATDCSFILNAYEKIRQGQGEIIIASRALKESVLVKKQTVYRRMIGFVNKKITKFLLALPYEDTQCGCKVFHKKTVVPLFTSIEESGFAFDIEILLKAKKFKYTVLELPCVWTDQEGSTVRWFSDSLKMLKAELRLRKKYNNSVIENEERK